MKESIPLPTQDYMVNISCMTYNHEKYIEDALKGFVMQKTNFPFCALVIDDASTDGTADVIRKYENKYPNIIKAIYLKENHYSQKRSKLPYYKPWRERSKYIALCEGDDYWIDPYKLQKQVDFLENNPNYGLIYSKAQVYIQKNNIFKNVLGKKCNFDILLKEGNYIPTLTTCFRYELYKNYQKEILIQKDWKMGDYPLWLYISYHSNIKFVPEITGIYRELTISASHNPNPNINLVFFLSAYKIREFFAIYTNNYYTLKEISLNSFNFIINYAIDTDTIFKFNFIHYIKKYHIYNLKLILKYYLSHYKYTRAIIRTFWNINSKIYNIIN